jgi:membrane protein YqaA with SNARE-associated domain
MTTLLLTLAAAVGGGFASAFLPVVNAEALAGAGAATLNPSPALLVAVALAVGQTAGKLLIYETARRGSGTVARRWARRRGRAGTSREEGRDAVRVGAGSGGLPEPGGTAGVPGEAGGGAGAGTGALPEATAATAAKEAEEAKEAEGAETGEGAEEGGRWRRALEWLHRPGPSTAIVFTSAGVGLPPLAVVSAAAGVARTPRSLFAVACLSGRVLRFGALVLAFEATSG